MKNKNQLAEGSLVRNLFTIAWPIIMANVLQTAYQLIDTFWLGRLGANAVAAVSISFPILFLVLSLGSGLTLAGTVIVSQFKGSDDPKMIDFTASQTVFIVFLISILLALLGYVSAAPLMNLIGAGPEILNDSVTYFQVSSFGFVFLFMFFVFQSVMRGIGNVLLPMYIVFGTVLLNLVLDPIFIFGYGSVEGYGVAGAAIASVITQGLSAVAGLYILFKGKQGIKIKLSCMKLEFRWVKRIFELGIPASLEQSSRAAVMTLMVMLVTNYGSNVVAAYGIGARILSLVIVPSIGMGIATTTLIGQSIGAGQIKQAEKIGDLSVKVAFFGLTGIGLLLFVFAENLTAFFVPNDPQVIKDGAKFIRIMSLSFGLLGVQQVLNGVFNGSRFTQASLLISIFSLWVARFPTAFILSTKTELSFEGIWWAFPISNLIAAVVAFSYYKTGYWKIRTFRNRNEWLQSGMK